VVFLIFLLRWFSYSFFGFFIVGCVCGFCVRSCFLMGGFWIVTR